MTVTALEADDAGGHGTYWVDKRVTPNLLRRAAQGTRYLRADPGPPGLGLQPRDADSF